MSATRSVENPSATIDNSLDAGRKIPSSAVAPLIATSKDAGVRIGSPVFEKLVGPGIGASVGLLRPCSKVVHIQSFVTSTGFFPTATRKANLAETTDYTVTKKDATTGLGKITNASGVDYSSNTWLIWYQPDEDEGTIGGQSAATKGIPGS